MCAAVTSICILTSDDQLSRPKVPPRRPPVARCAFLGSPAAEKAFSALYDACSAGKQGQSITHGSPDARVVHVVAQSPHSGHDGLVARGHSQVKLGATDRFG